MFPRCKILAALLPAFSSLSVAAQQLAVLDPILVTATRTETRANSLLSDVSVVSREDLRAAPQASLPELLGTLPGVQFVSNGGVGSAGSLFLRGTNSEHSVVLVDGQRLASATLGTTAIEHIPLEQIERIEVVRGPVSSLYGADAIGGVIQIFTRRGEGTPAPSFALGYGRYNTTTGSAGYGGRLGATQFDLRVGWEESGAFSTYRNPVGGFFDPYNSDRDAYRNRNFNVQISHQLTDKLEVGAQVFHVSARKHFDATNCDSFFVTCTAAYDSRLRQELEAYSTFLRFKPVAAWTTQLKLGQSRDQLRNWRLDPSLPAEFIDRYTTTQDQISWQNDFSLGQAGKILAAYDWRGEHVGSTQPFTVHDRRNNALVLGYQGWYGPHSLQMSLRRDDISRFAPRTSSSLAYGYDIGGGLRARAALGRAYHVPTFNHLYWPADPINFYQGNPNLKVERASNREVGLQYEQGSTQAGLTVYRNRVTDLLNYVPAFVFPFLGQYENVGQATLKGASLTLAHGIGNWNLRAGMDYLNAKDDLSGRALQRRVPRTANVELSYRQGVWETGVQLFGYSGHYNDSGNTQWLGGYALTNVFATYRVDAAWSVVGRASNVFDRKYVAVRDAFNGNDYSVPGAALFVGVRYEPK